MMNGIPKQKERLDPSTRHRDKILDDFCDNHPGSPMCKVFDE